MDNNEFLKEQLDLIKKKQIDTSIEWQDVADFRSSHGKEPEHRDTIRKGSKLLLEYIDAGWDLFPSSSIQLGRFSDEIALKKERIKLQTEKQEFNKWIREYSRDELIAEHIVNAVNQLQPLNVPGYIPPVHMNKEYLLTISDAHFGVEFEIKEFIWKYFKCI